MVVPERCTVGCFCSFCRPLSVGALWRVCRASFLRCCVNLRRRMSCHVLDVAVLRYHSVVNSDPEYDLMNVSYVLIEI